MAGNDVYLYSVPSDADQDDVRLRDPTTIAGAGAITGTLAVTLDAVTLVSAGQVIIDGDLSATLSDLTLSSAGQLVIDGTLGVTLGILTAGAVSNLEIAATEGTTLGALTLSSAGQVVIDGDLSVTLGAVSLLSEAIAPAIPAESTSGPAPINRERLRAKANAAHAAMVAAREASEVQRQADKVVARRRRQAYPQNRRLAR